MGGVLANQSVPAGHRIRAAVVSSFLALLFVASLLGLPRWAGSASGSTALALRTIAHTDVNPYGANFFLEWEAEPWKVEKTLQMAKEAGIEWVKQQFPWEELEPKKGKFWDDKQNRSTWEKYDRIVDLARKMGLQIIARLDRPPSWSRRDNTLKEAPPDNFEDYGDFVFAVVEHFKGRVNYYQLWNEPNVRPEWGNRPPDPADYVRLLSIGYRRAKEADPNVFILNAPLAQTLERSPSALDDLEYLEQMYREGTKTSFDIFFANVYGFSLPPEDVANPGRLNFRRVLLAREIMERHGDGNKAVWFNEFGWNASPEGFAPAKLIWGRVTEEQQAQFAVRAIQQARTEWPWAGVFCLWYFRQAGHIPPDRSDYYFRMVDVGFTPRLLYHAIKRDAAALGVAPPGDYQPTNPALTSDGAWRLVSNEATGGKLLLVTERAGDTATITFTGSEVHLLVRQDPESGILEVTVDGQPANRLPFDREGRAHLDLYSTTPQSGIEVLLAAGLPPGRHTARLVLSATRNPAAKGGRAAVEGFSVREAGVTPAWALVPWVLGGLTGISTLFTFWWWRRPAPAPRGP